MTRKKKNLISYVVFALVCVAIIIAGICYKNYSNEQKIKKAEKNAVTCVDDLTGKKSVFKSVQQVTYMHLITRVTRRAQLSSVTTKVLMPSKHSKMTR